MFIVIIGSGRTGSSLANLLSDAGHEIVIVDKNNDRFNNLSVNFSGFTVEGDGLEYDILRKAKIKKADVVVITTGNDNVNFMITQIGREIFNVPHILVRVIDPDKEDMFEDITSVKILSSTNLLIQAFNKKIQRIEG